MRNKSNQINNKINHASFVRRVLAMHVERSKLRSSPYVGDVIHMYRTKLANLARDFVELHDEQQGSREAAELMRVIMDGVKYRTAMRRVMQIKKEALDSKRTRKADAQ